MVESLPDAVIAIGINRKVCCLNQAAKRLVGCSLKATAKGHALDDMLRLLDGKTRAPIVSTLDHLLHRRAGTRKGDYDILVRPNGSEVPIEHSANPILSAAGAVVGTLFVLRDASRTRDLVRRLNVRATYDGLTRILNRAEFERRLARLLKNMNDGDRHALVFLDLDGFKRINDTYGHGAGDAVLRDVARILRARARERDSVARLGGDEFGLLLEHCPAQTAAEFARTLGWALEAHEFRFGDKRFHLGASVGLAFIPSRQSSVRQLLTAADDACYAVKRAREAGGLVPPPAAAFAPTLLHS